MPNVQKALSTQKNYMMINKGLHYSLVKVAPCLRSKNLSLVSVVSPTKQHSFVYKPVCCMSNDHSIASEEVRLEKDKEARKEMSQIEANVTDSWKWDVRSHIWGLMESQNIARSPRPVHHQIPNFQGADAAAEALADLDLFKNAKRIKVNPDTPQKKVRELVLAQRKLLYVPQPRLRTGFFSLIDPTTPFEDSLWNVVSPAGVKHWGKALDLNDNINVDLVVVGSVAVHPETGARVGKGEGFAELEYGMLRMLGAITADTKVVTTVHDCQVTEMVKSENLMEHDVPVDIIITPTRVIYTTPTKAKPEGILWHLLSQQKLDKIKVLQTLKAKIESKEGRKLETGLGVIS